MTTPAETDPPELDSRLWHGFGGDLAFDVGANYGQSLPHILAAFKRAVALEPSPVPFAYLQEHWEGEFVHCLNVGASDHRGELHAIELGDGQYVYPGTHGVTDLSGDRYRVAGCVTLDSLAATFGHPDLVKVDTEGHEVEVLLGARRILRNPSPDWLIEFHTPENLLLCLDTLGAHGYETEVVRHPHYPEGSDNWHQHGWIRALSHDRSEQ